VVVARDGDARSGGLEAKLSARAIQLRSCIRAREGEAARFSFCHVA
jgi:hypothetical protein